MRRPKIETVEEYLALQPDTVRSALERVREIVRRALPDAEEGISYQILAYRLYGTHAFYVAGFPDHYAIYPSSPRVLDALGQAITPHLSGRGTMRFDLAGPVPARLIGRIVKLKAEDAAARARERAAPKAGSRRRAPATRR